MVTEKKPPLKSEIIEQLKVLQKDYDTLKHEHTKNLCTIRNLEEEVSQLKNPLVGKSSKGSQTFSEEIQICCNICIYVATCEEELNWHMEQEHDQSGDSFFDKDFYCDICSKWFDTDSEMKKHRKDHQKPKLLIIENDGLYCNFCEEKFFRKKDLMKHKKNAHIEKVSICWNFVAGTCDLGDKNCWFNHCKSLNDSEAEHFKCRSCEKVFKSQPECLKHRKLEHSNFVPLCKNEMNGTCKFGNTNCWFIHDSIKKTNRNEHHEKSIESELKGNI